MSYKQGDRVLILDSDPVYAGKSGIVRSFRDGQIEVEFDNGKGTFVFFRDVQLLVQPNAKVVHAYKVGDRVLGEFFNGERAEGTVTKLHPPGYPGKIAVRFDNYDSYQGAGDYHAWDPRTLIPVSANVPEESAEEIEHQQKTVYAALRLTTVSATFVLASGRVVHMPDPVGDNWVLDDLNVFPEGTGVSVTTDRINISNVLLKDMDTDMPINRVNHEQGRCWLKDMERIVNARDRKSPFEERFACITVLRYFKVKLPEPETDNLSLPTLRAYLW